MGASVYAISTIAFPAAGARPRVLPAPAALVALLVAAPLAAPVAGMEGDGTLAVFCEATAPVQAACTVSFVAPGNSTVEVLHKVAFSGTLDIVAEQRGVAIWNATCVVPLGFRDTGVGLCFPEPANPPAYQPGVRTNVTISTGYYGAGTFGVRVWY